MTHPAILETMAEGGYARSLDERRIAQEVEDAQRDAALCEIENHVHDEFDCIARTGCPVYPEVLRARIMAGPFSQAYQDAVQEAAIEIFDNQ